jgi:hypothetical protein
MIRSVLQSESHSALELFHSSWTTTGPVSQARKRQKICLLGRAMFQGQYARHLFAALNFERSVYTSWYADALAYVDKTHTI